jgi:hypothetical protein
MREYANVQISDVQISDVQIESPIFIIIIQFKNHLYIHAFAYPHIYLQCSPPST